ncbi:MAG: SDR family oxidoreductase, partial [Pseudomonas sp.]
MNGEKNIFITGATGFLGSHLLYARRNMNEKYFALTRPSRKNSSKDRLLKALKTASESYRFFFDSSLYENRIIAVEGDISLPKLGISQDYLSTLPSENIDQFWHFASSLSWEGNKKEVIYSTNVEGIQEALKLASHMGAKKFIYVSTAYTCGKSSGLIEEVLHPKEGPFNNYYEETKCHAEHIVSDYCTQNNIDYVILRPSMVIGPLGTKRSGGTTVGLYGFMRQISKTRRVLENLPDGISILGNPLSRPNIVPIDMVIEDINSIITTAKYDGGIYHLCSDFAPETHRCLEIVSTVVGVSTIKCISDFTGERSPVEKIIDTRIQFYNSYCQEEKEFARSLACNKRGVSDTEFIGYVSEAYKE